jgi:hypothetical protein
MLKRYRMRIDSGVLMHELVVRRGGVVTVEIIAEGACDGSHHRRELTYGPGAAFGGTAAALTDRFTIL